MVYLSDIIIFLFFQSKIMSLSGKHSDVLGSLSANVLKRVESLRDIQVCIIESVF